MDLSITTKKPHLPHQWDYEAGDTWAYSQLSESTSDLKNLIEEFKQGLTLQSQRLLSYSRLLDTPEKASSVRRCFSKASWKNNEEALKKCLRKEGIDLSKDRHIARDSEGGLVGVHATSLKERIEGLGRLVELTEELEQEKRKILEKLNKYLHFAELPQIPEKEEPEE